MIQRLRAWWQQRRLRAALIEQAEVAVGLDMDQCETCGCWFPRSELVVISESFTDDHLLAGGHVFGGTGISATFCIEHALDRQA